MQLHLNLGVAWTTFKNLLPYEKCFDGFTILLSFFAVPGIIQHPHQDGTFFFCCSRIIQQILFHKTPKWYRRKTLHCALLLVLVSN